jgi:hypothetical protein
VIPELCPNMFDKADEPWTYRCVLAKGHDGECDPQLRPPPRESTPIPPYRGDFYNMACWNGLSPDQQERLIRHGNLEIGYKPEGPCPNPAQVAIETENDQSPGPRFYCRSCGVAYLVVEMREMPHLDLVFWRAMDARIGIERTDEERREAWAWWIGKEPS